MSIAPVPADAGAVAQKLALNQAIIRGRVLEVKRSDTGCFTAITLPSPDLYSQPQAVEVRSKNLIGRPSEDVTLRVMLGGFRRGYQDKHGEKAYATNITLTAVED
jgi:hypothetical protein